MENNEETVTISVKEYEELKKSEEILDALDAGGVDNWEWYGESLAEYWADEDD